MDPKVGVCEVDGAVLVNDVAGAGAVFGSATEAEDGCAGCTGCTETKDVVKGVMWDSVDDKAENPSDGLLDVEMIVEMG